MGEDRRCKSVHRPPKLLAIHSRRRVRHSDNEGQGDLQQERTDSRI